ncbi:MAG TPA: amidohydrolase family protein [Planctomycetota bacterium]|nr:amidohydrolase family protein [Planctomycetota bacterium]
MRNWILVLVILPLAHAGAAPSPEPADMLLVNGNVITVDKAFSFAEAVAIRDGLIAAVGTSKDLRKLQDEKTEVIDLKGATVVPGFIDSHADHLPFGSDLAQEISAYGLTTVHVPLDAKSFDRVKQLAADGKLPFRVYAKRTDPDPTKPPEIGLHANHVTSRCAWIAYIDGPMQSRTAALVEPYSDAPKESGKLRHRTEDLVKKAKELMGAGYQIMMKTIGDGGARQALDVIEQAQKDAKAGDLRPMIHRLQHVHPDDLPRLKKLGVVVSMAPGHCISDIPWAEQRLGPNRVKFAYAWKTVAEQAAGLGFETDGPIPPFGSDRVWKKPLTSQFNPLLSIYWSVTRADHEGSPNGGWHAEECVSIKTALKAFTINGAFNGFEEKLKGSIEAGKLADLAILSKDILKISAIELLETKVRMTLLGGKIVFKSQDWK